jgi:hypothetical protein
MVWVKGRDTGMGLHEMGLGSSRMRRHSALPCKHARLLASRYPALEVGWLRSAICISLAALSRSTSKLARLSTLMYTDSSTLALLCVTPLATCLTRDCLPLTASVSRSLSGTAKIYCASRLQRVLAQKQYLLASTT